jgi:hypothetical protein
LDIRPLGGAGEIVCDGVHQRLNANVAEARACKHWYDPAIANPDSPPDGLFEKGCGYILVLGQELFHDGIVKIGQALDESLSPDLQFLQ